MASLLERVDLHGFRAARDVSFEPRALCVLVGEASSGKSTVLTALWSLLEASAPVPTAEDVTRGGDGRIRLEAVVGGDRVFLDARPPGTLNLNREGAPPAIFLPANLRGGLVVAATSDDRAAVAAAFVRPAEEALNRGDAIVEGLEALGASGLDGLVVMVEEPELYLGPHAQRHLYRVFRRLADGGNQVLYSTHSPTFLSVDRLEELAIVRHRRGEGTVLLQPRALPEGESFRALAEFDADRAELFISRAALIVEGRTEKLVLPLVFEMLGYDADRERIAILACGGKSTMPLFAGICNECRIPYVVLHDRDAPVGKEPVESEQALNAAILEAAGPRQTVVLIPDFEGVSGVRARSRKPQKAWRRYHGGETGDIPEPLREAVERVVAAARGKPGRRRRTRTTRSGG
ncbi:MAG TPA: AAA family ATPase [Gaiellaceae bacterium]|nr:AAA family ATPase [Gaiellaceae bacterium]